MDFERLTVSRAKVYDMDEILRIQAEGNEWNAGKGFLPLAFRYSPEERREFLRRQMNESEVYVARNEVEAVGMIRVQWTDPVFWGDAGWDPLAGYIHGLILGNSYHGQGLGKWLLRWAEGLLVEKGRVYSRLDCMKENLRLRTYYESIGYADKGEVKLKNGWVSRLLEKHIGL